MGVKSEPRHSRLRLRFPRPLEMDYRSTASLAAHRVVATLSIAVVDDGPHPYDQTNHYTWSDGRTEVREFPAEYRDKRVWWNNELIIGWAAEVGLDEYSRTVMLYWQRTGDPSLYLYEMIQLADDGVNRCRTWHWIRNGLLETRTAIQETLVTRDWRSLEA